MLILICPNISSRALSRVFEHRNVVARCQREIHHITVAKVAPLVTIDTSIYIIDILVRQNTIWSMNIAVLWLFYLMSSPAGYTIQTHSVYFLFPSCIVDMFENKSISCFAFFYLPSLGSSRHSSFCALCNYFMNTGYIFYILHRLFLYFTSSADSHE